MVFNIIFNNISVISWRSVLLVEETGVLIYKYYLYPLTINSIRFSQLDIYRNYSPFRDGLAFLIQSVKCLTKWKKKSPSGTLITVKQEIKEYKVPFITMLNM